jgi:hypothetical protein
VSPHTVLTIIVSEKEIGEVKPADHVLALGIHFPAVREHLGRHIRQRECED